MNSSYYKCCIVPQCKSTTIKTPDKLFIYVPNNEEIRRKWLKMARRQDALALSTNSTIYFCEDHFDLPNDMINYTEYHVMGKVSRVRMKQGCVPKKFECQEDRRKRTCSYKERLYMLKKQRMSVIAECLNEPEQSSTPSASVQDTSNTSSVFKMVKTNAEMCRNYYNRKKAAKEAEKIRQGLSVNKPIRKTGAERTRAYRLRKKLLSQVNESSVTEILSTPSTSNSLIRTFKPSFHLSTTSASTNRPDVSMVSSTGIADHDVLKMGKTNAEYCKEYYYRKKAAKAAEKQEAGLLVERPIRKTGAERNRAYKLRKKMLAQANQSSVNEILSAPSTSNSQIMTSGPPSQPVTTERNMPRRRTLTGHKERVHHRLLQRQIRNQQKQHFHQDEAHFPEFASDFEDNVVIKKENMMSDVTIKQELDIEPIVLQPRSKPGLCPPSGYLTMDFPLGSYINSSQVENNDKNLLSLAHIEKEGYVRVTKAECMRNHYDKNNQQILYWGPKTAAERCRAYRERKKKAENNPQVHPRPKTAAERCRAYRERKRKVENKPQVYLEPKTAAERCRAYRERKRKAENKPQICPLPKTSTDRVREFRKRRREQADLAIQQLREARGLELETASQPEDNVIKKENMIYDVTIKQEPDIDPLELEPRTTSDLYSSSVDEDNIVIKKENMMSDVTIKQEPDIDPLNLETTITSDLYSSSVDKDNIIIKKENVMSNVTIKQEPDIDPLNLEPRITSDLYSSSVDEDDVFIKKENMVYDVTIKQEQDIDPIVLQLRTTPVVYPPSTD